MVRPMAPTFYLATSKTTGITRDELAHIARWIGAEPHYTRPLPADRPGLVLNVENMRLFAPGRKPTPWHPGMAHWRLRRPSDRLPEIMGVEPGHSVVDATLGMGHDALLLARAGADVLALEQQAPLLFFTLDGMWHYRPDLARNIRGMNAEHADWLARAPDESVDHVFFDPMFPADKGGESVTWTTLRTVARPGPRLPDAVLLDAVRVARRSVCLKLAPFEPAPRVQGAPTMRVDGSKRLHFAVWDVAGG